MSIRTFARAALLLAATALLASSASAANETAAAASSERPTFGPRIGISSSPDQLVLGGQVTFPDFAPHLSVSPNVELGFLDNETTVAINADFDYHFEVKSQWKPYAGAGAALVVTQPSSGSSSTDAGLNLIGGAAVPTRTGNQFFGELRIGLGDIASVKLIAGWNFSM